ncbi:MAG: TfoX/Sxy family protein [Patescibacteria group bacterium]
MKRNEFVAYLVEELLSPLGGVTARAMFGGFGIYKDGAIVGIVVDDELYLKVDETNKAEYEKMGSKPFSYKKNDGKNVAMSYWNISSEIIENPKELLRLVEESYEISLFLFVQERKRLVTNSSTARL